MLTESILKSLVITGIVAMLIIIHGDLVEVKVYREDTKMVKLLKNDLRLLTMANASGGEVVEYSKDYTVVELPYIEDCKSFSTLSLIIVPTDSKEAIIEHEKGHIALGHVLGESPRTVKGILKLEEAADGFVSYNNLWDLYGILNKCDTGLGLIGDYLRIVRMGFILKRIFNNE